MVLPLVDLPLFGSARFSTEEGSEHGTQLGLWVHALVLCGVVKVMAAAVALGQQQRGK
jgi:hypothetical protein